MTCVNPAKTKTGTADVIGRLRCMEEQLSWHGDLATGLTPGCRTAALASLQEVIKEVEEKLSDHFDDVSIQHLE
jgi:hypothetical protein